VGKSGVLEHKAAISLKRVKIEEKLLYIHLEFAKWQQYKNTMEGL